MSEKLTNKIQFRNTISSNVFREFLGNLTPETQFTFNHFGKIDQRTITSIIKKELNRRDKLKFFVFLNKKLIAYGFLTKFEKPTKKHNCVLGIVIADPWQNKGFGTRICKKMIEMAWKQGFEKIWLTVYADNVNAVKMYKSLGFEIEGVFMKDEKVGRGYRNVISMAIFRQQKNDNTRRKIWNYIEKNSF
jgi:RimJ/RimL family protein N-acetyltransferase